MAWQLQKIVTKVDFLRLKGGEWSKTKSLTQ